MLDIISPCVTFNNHETSSKSYPYGKAHEEPIQDITFIPHYEEIVFEEPEPGKVQTVGLHDGSHVYLKKLDPDYDPTDRGAAFQLLEAARREEIFLTGLIYIDENRQTVAETSHLVDEPLVRLQEDVTRPSREALDRVMNHLICCD